MQTRHMPTVGARYWSAITLASLFGTNLGDFYANETGLGTYAGVAILAVLAAAAFVAERRDPVPRELWYWLVIIIIRTGATNIADYLAYKVRIPDLALSLGLAALVAGFGWASLHRRDRAEAKAEAQGMPATGGAYWAAMLSAGVFGTVVGDIAQHHVGQGPAALELAVLLAVALAIWRTFGDSRVWIYWLTVAVARTAGTAMGDYLAESDTLGIGLAVATLITGSLLLLVLLLWPSRRWVEEAGANPST
jgi:uncharacterized membrane-anchored protein